MLNIGNGIIYFYSEPVSMHKSFEGLSVAVRQSFPGKLSSGSAFVFLNRSRDKIKLLFWDGDGFVILYKRLEKGKFYVSASGKSDLSRRDFLMLFEGIRPRYLDRRFSIQKRY